MVRLAWFLLAVIHALPAVALVRPSLLATLYGVELVSPAYALLWHRAALFAAILLICCWAAIRPEVRRLAVVAVAISMVSFLIIYWGQGAPANLQTIAIVDLIGLPLLAFVGWGAFRSAS
jgi:hypothetical protein